MKSSPDGRINKDYGFFPCLKGIVEDFFLPGGSPILLVLLIVNHSGESIKLIQKVERAGLI